MANWLNRLPSSYHRFHIPVDGKITKMNPIKGEYYTVNPMAIRSDMDIFLKNKRHVTLIETPSFGTVAYVSIGATLVGSILFTKNVWTLFFLPNSTEVPSILIFSAFFVPPPTLKVGDSVSKGEEHGYFAFGGSTIILLFQKGTISFDEDLLTESQKPLENLVKMGERVGVKPKGA